MGKKCRKASILLGQDDQKKVNQTYTYFYQVGVLVINPMVERNAKSPKQQIQ